MANSSITGTIQIPAVIQISKNTIANFINQDQSEIGTKVNNYCTNFMSNTVIITLPIKPTTNP